MKPLHEWTDEEISQKLESLKRQEEAHSQEFVNQVQLVGHVLWAIGRDLSNYNVRSAEKRMQDLNHHLLKLSYESPKKLDHGRLKQGLVQLFDHLKKYY